MDNDKSLGKRSKRKKRIGIILISVLAALVLFRLFLPYIVLQYVNKKLSQLTEYYGHVDDIEIALLRGAYVIKDLRLDKIEKKNGIADAIPFFKAPVMDLSIEWRALFKGALVGEVLVDDPVLNYVEGKHKKENVRADTADFRKIIDDLMPLTINHFEIHQGEIHFIDRNRKPGIDVSLKQIEAVSTNLSNVNKSAKILPAHCDATGHAYEGDFTLKMDFDGLNKVPTFDMKAELKNLNLVKLNDFLKAYGNFEVSNGRVGIYTEFAAEKGEFGGYVKPIIKDIKVVQGTGGIKQMLWELFVGASSKILKNPSTQQVATKIDVSGRFDDPGVNVWRAVSFLLRNAFVQALKPAIDNSINIHHLEEGGKKTFLEKVFGSGKKEHKNK